MNRKRAIMTSCSIILLCSAIIVGITFALFNEQVELSNHLRAGELAVTLTRTNLEYKTLDAKGHLVVVEDDEDIDFTTTTNKDKNIFNITDDTLVAPGSYFASTMKLQNNGSVAFTYEVGLKLYAEETGTNIADQMLITVTDVEGNLLVEKPMLLSDFHKDGTMFTLLQGEMDAGAVGDEFIINVKFLDDNDEADRVYLDENADNDLAKNEIAKFDLHIVAIQKTPDASQDTTDSESASETEESSETSGS